MHLLRNRSAAAILWAALMALVGQASADIVGVEYSESNSRLVRINQGTGVGNAVGNTGFTRLNSLSSNSFGVLYSAPNAGPSLITIDLSTGAGTSGATINLGVAPDIRGLAFSPGNVLFAANNTGPGGLLNPDELYSINTSTGVGTLVGATGISGLQSLEFSSVGMLYGWDVDIGLVTINTTTGVASDVNPAIGGTAAIQSIAFAPDGTLYGACNALFTIDVATGATTLVGSGGYSDVRGIEYVAAVPEPSTLALFVMGFAVLITSLFPRLLSKKALRQARTAYDDKVMRCQLRATYQSGQPSEPRK